MSDEYPHIDEKIRETIKDYGGTRTVTITGNLVAPKIVYDSVKDSGAREEFDTGSVRDTQQGKGRYDLIPVGPLKRLAKHYENGANKYGDRNWEKGQPSSRYYSSAMRHLTNYMDGDRSEDHLAAVAWNAFAMMFNEEKKPELDDITNSKQEVVSRS